MKLCLSWVCFSTLVNLFLFNIDTPRGGTSRCPSRADFIGLVFPQLQELQATVLAEVAAGICGTVATNAGISTADVTSADDNSAVGNSAPAGISADGVSVADIAAAGISAAVGSSAAGQSVGVNPVEESPLSVEGSQVGDDEDEVGLDQLRLSGSVEELTAGGTGSSADDEHKKSLINLSKTRQSRYSLLVV